MQHLAGNPKRFLFHECLYLGHAGMEGCAPVRVTEMAATAAAKSRAVKETCQHECSKRSRIERIASSRCIDGMDRERGNQTANVTLRCQISPWAPIFKATPRQPLESNIFAISAGAADLIQGVYSEIESRSVWFGVNHALSF